MTRGWRRLRLVCAIVIVASPASALSGFEPATRPDQTSRTEPRRAPSVTPRSGRGEAGPNRAGVRGEIARLQKRSVAAHADFVRARAKLAGLNAREAALATRVGANRTSLVRLLGALELWRRNPAPALVVEPRRAVDAARAAMLMRAATPELERRAHVLGGEVRELARVRRDAAQADAALFAAESAAAEARTVADTLAARSGASALDALLSPEERKAQSQARAEQPGVALEARPDRPAPPPENLRPPLAGTAVHGWGDAWEGHGRAEGLVWRAAPGETVSSPTAGRVEYAGPLKGFALVVILRLAGDWRLVLSGLQSVSAAPGAMVSAGETLGRMARRSELRGPAELYLELRRGVHPVDPSAHLQGSRR